MAGDNIDVSIIVKSPSIGVTINSVGLDDETIIDGGTPSLTGPILNGGTP